MICPRACFSSKIAALIDVYLIMKPETTQCRAADRVKRGFALELKGTGNLERPRMRLRLAWPGSRQQDDSGCTWKNVLERWLVRTAEQSTSMPGRDGRCSPMNQGCKASEAVEVVFLVYGSLEVFGLETGRGRTRRTVRKSLWGKIDRDF